MTYARVMVPIDLGPYAADRIALAGSLADRFGSLLIGIAAQRPIPAYDEESAADAELIEAEQRRVDDDLTEVERVFRTSSAVRNRVEWRASSAQGAEAFAIEQARAADILVVTRQGSDDAWDWRFGVNPGGLALQAGRPVFVAPPAVASVTGQRVLIAWKDTREARRAVLDALPLLKQAERVLIVAVRENDRVAGALDVADYLASHGVQARTLLRDTRHASVSEELLKVVAKEQVDLVIAGAYGRTRLREWVFGGVSHDLLDRAPVCCLMSH
jgi:nucleotide-binding universal stress UspA family protein